MKLISKKGSHGPRPRVHALLGGGLVAIMLASCHDLEDFKTEPGEAYCGNIVQFDAFQQGFVDSNRMPQGMRMRLTLDVEALRRFPNMRTDSKGNALLPKSPGRITTNDQDCGVCSAEGSALFEDAPLASVQALQHDELSLLQFGQARTRNFFAWLKSSCKGTMLSVISLMSDASVEVRVFRPGERHHPDDPIEEQSGYAVFHLKKADENCFGPQISCQ